MPCDPSFLANITMFELLNEDDRIALAKVVDELSLPADHTLFQAGDPGDSLFIVRVGEIELFIKDTAGQKIVLTRAEQGDMFGEDRLDAAAVCRGSAQSTLDAILSALDRFRGSRPLGDDSTLLVARVTDGPDDCGQSI